MFAELTEITTTGLKKPIWIAPAHVFAIQQHDDSSTYVYMSNRQYAYLVDGDPKSVAKALYKESPFRESSKY